MKNWKRALCFGIGLCVAFVRVAYGNEEVPPNPMGNEEVLFGQMPVGVSLPGPDFAGGSRTLTVGASSETKGPGGTGQAPGEQTPGGQLPARQPSGEPSSVLQAPGGQPSGEMPAGQTDSAASQTVIQAPEIAAEGAVLMDAATGKVLYGKNADQQFYPASITKVMTALLTVENCNLSDVVTFSRTATTNLESGAVTISLTEGDQLTVKDSLYALLLKSANEVANGLAEHMGGTIDNFANMMNVRAAQLGCTGTHFANPNGLNNAAHLTTPYDMALIARAAYANPVISQISTTTAYQMPATKLGAAKTITMGHKMLYPTDSRYYPGMVGGKTGYTSKAGNTLVTCVEQNGVRLVVVVMKAGGTHYTDTKALLDYGFALAANGEI